MGCRCGACRSDLLLKPCVGRQPCCNGALVRKIVTEIMRHFWLLRCPSTNSGRETEGVTVSRFENRDGPSRVCGSTGRSARPRRDRGRWLLGEWLHRVGRPCASRLDQVPAARPSPEQAGRASRQGGAAYTLLRSMSGIHAGIFLFLQITSPAARGYAYGG